MPDVNGKVASRMYSLNSAMIAAVVVAVLSGSCYPDTGTTLCNTDTGLNCPPGFSCSQDRNSCIPGNCGNGRIEKEFSEECDDGNIEDGDGCDSNCTTSRCGNGVRAGREECDDRNDMDGDGCDYKCKRTRCGNGIVTSLEECDLGLINSDSGRCLTNCRLAECGDGFIQNDVEECDTGSVNSDNGACLTNCRIAKCGDGFVQADVEECDDGNNNGCGTCMAGCAAFWERAHGTISVTRAESGYEGDWFVLKDGRLLSIKFLYTFVGLPMPPPEPNIVPILLTQGQDAMMVAEATKNAINDLVSLRITASLSTGTGATVRVVQDDPGVNGNSPIVVGGTEVKFSVMDMSGGTGDGCLGGIGCKSNADCKSGVCLPTKLCQSPPLP